MFTSADISVVIPSYNSFNTIGACLDSLVGQTKLALEIILVDSSTDATADYVNRFYPQVQVHRLKHRTFPGPARNFGASVARGSLVAFIDADCIASPDWLERIARRHSEGHLVVGGAIEVGNPSSVMAWAGHLGEFREFLPVGEARQMLHIPTCNISYRKQLFSKHKGFPNAYYPQEDLLFNFMLNQQGIHVWFDPDIRVRHFCREDLRGYLSHQHRIGRVTRCTLKRINLPGAAVARRAWLAWLASPVLGLVKFIRTSSVFISFFGKASYTQPALLYLLLFLGAVWWARGFASGARTGLSGIRGWTDPDEPIFSYIIELEKQRLAQSISEKPGS